NRALEELAHPPIMFLSCSDEVLIRRLSKEGRSLHPLSAMLGMDISVEEALSVEKRILLPVKEKARFIIDTTLTSVWGLRRKIFEIYTSPKDFSDKFARYFLSDSVHYDQVLLDVGKNIVKKVISEIKPLLLFDSTRAGEKVENLREKDPEDETRKIDIVAEQEYITGLENNVGVPYLLITEESGEIEVGKSNPDLLVFVDPLDGTDLAIRRIPLCATSICFYSKSLNEFLAAVVGDVFTGIIYYASKSQSGAYIEGSDYGPIRIFPSRVKNLSEAFISNFAIKPQRLLSLGEQKSLINNSLRVFNNGGPLEICRVASADADALIEFNKGFAGYDLYSGAFILSKAGGVCKRLDRERLQVQENVNYRQKFIATCTEELFDNIISVLKL
ncbi:MAG TPA: RNase adapter RapZ, partial [Candidatus Eremiobacteraeota bacterium]|nr:RNase adapter RapZ [Candidatus Eremiobacteraeota bacterium]